MDKRRKKRGLVIGLLVGAVVIAVSGAAVKILLDRPAEEKVEVAEKPETESEEVYGFVDPETVTSLVMKFNQRIGEQATEGLGTADEMTMVVHENTYWYPLYEDVALVVVPREFSGNKDEDTVLTMLIYTDKESTNRELAMAYWKNLIGINDANLTDEEVVGLLAEAENLRERGEMANKGTGIFVAINDSEDHLEYQVVRNYRE